MKQQNGRRKFIEGGLTFLAFLGMPVALAASDWPEPAFESMVGNEALLSLFGTARIEPSGDIALSAPLVAENGVIVPISVATTLPGVKSISIVVEKNPRPLVVFFELPAGTLPEIACRIKMAETSDVLAVVETSSGLFSTSARVKVTLGGCA